MIFLTSLLSVTPFLNWPHTLGGWLVLVGLISLTVYLVYRWRELHTHWGGNQIFLLAMLFLITPLTSLYFGLRLPPGPALPLPRFPIEPEGPALMLFAALPWILAGGLLGPLPAACLGAISGSIFALWDTHSSFTPLEYALLATLLSIAFRQRYRTPFFRLLRHPLVAGAFVALFYPLLFLIDALSLAGGPFAAGLDFAITRVGMASLSVAGQLFVAGLLAEVIKIAWPHAWAARGPLVPSPIESSLVARFQYTLGAVFFLLVVLLVVGDWIVAGRAARQMLNQRMADTAQVGAESIPFFLETGQNLILQIASDTSLYTTSTANLGELLAQHLRSAPYFRQLSVLDANGNDVAGYPVVDFDSLFPTLEERSAIDLALQGVVFQYYTVAPVEGDKAAQVSFITAILDAQGQVRGVLVGRSDLASNPFTKPLLTNLDKMSALGGEGMLLDESRRILYHPLSNLVMTSYLGRLPDDAKFFDETGPDGTRRLVYFQPVVGRSWAVVLTVSAQQAQQLALNIAVPLLGLLLILTVLILLLMRVGLRVVTGSLQSLTVEVDRIARGQLDHPLVITSVDEVGRLGRGFEQMRVSLKARLEELNRLLLVSQGVASSLEFETAVQPILESALATGASAARVVLSKQAMPELTDAPSSYGSGASSERYLYLDEQVMALTSRQNKVELSNPSRARLLNFDRQKAIPEALLAVALRHESLFYGTLWVAYDQPHRFAEDEVRFLTTLAGQAAVAAANSRLFLSAEIGRQRMEAILASTPDPVLVTDRQNRLLLANPAALQVLADGAEPGQGLPIGQVISQPEIIHLLEASSDEQRTAEFALPGGRYFYATASSVIAEGQRVGRVCVLQEITRFRELDALKSEFVQTVSHDLRSPLTLMRGYATMLQMVGEMNDQQTGYVRKIITSVESMSRLVSNLLDLGRIEAGIGLKLEKVSIPDLVERVTGTLQLLAVQKRINLSVDIPPHTTALVEADPALLQQALHNLVENAIKYTEPGGQVHVRVHERNANLIFEVVDTGIGIAPVDQARLFEKFYRGARRDVKYQRGSGLGLAIVKSIAERHGGRVWVESQLGKGSRFYLEIPIQQFERSTQKIR